MMLNKKKTKMASVVLAAGLMLNAAALCFGGESTAQSESETQDRWSRLRQIRPHFRCFQQWMCMSRYQ